MIYLRDRKALMSDVKVFLIYLSVIKGYRFTIKRYGWRKKNTGSLYRGGRVIIMLSPKVFKSYLKTENNTSSTYTLDNSSIII